MMTLEAPSEAIPFLSGASSFKAYVRVKEEAKEEEGEYAGAGESGNKGNKGDKDKIADEVTAAEGDRKNFVFFTESLRRI